MTASRPTSDDAEFDWRTFLPSTAAWFTDSLGQPTEAQIRSWPLIKAGGNVLIHSPTGSGKTLAAFLAAIDDAYSKPRQRKRNSSKPGVRVLYISPLRALNYDIERNLQAPISGIAEQLRSDAIEPAEISVAVRTGDTPPAERTRMVNHPPEFLITTPESFYLILTSPRARDILRTIETVIVDEIHTMCSNKRGVHLAISLERLERLAPGFQRIGLSATQNPLTEVANLLGGQTIQPDDSLQPRQVQIVDCAGRADLDVKVYGMPEADRSSPEYNVWQGIIPTVLDDIEQHRTTLVFTNSRRQAENTADRLNNVLVARDAGHDEADAVGGGVRGSGVAAGPFKAHHGSISDTMRHQIEADLKAGRLPALVGTSSLELGIDIGSIDMVVQLQSPKSVAQGLQRVGRAGHQVGTTSVAKIYATHPEDLMEATVVARGMLDGDIESMHIPTNALDVLAQQIVAAVAVDDWTTAELFDTVRAAYPYRKLARSTFDSVLELVSGHYPSTKMRTLRARVNWDRATDTVRSLPGTRRTAVSHAGTIVDRGTFNVVLPDRKTIVGNLDEEFVYESNAGDIFTLGSQTWRAIDIDDDKVVAEPAPGEVPRMPFWRGEFPWRQSDLGERFGAFRAAVADRLQPHLDDLDAAAAEPPEVIEWLTADYPIDEVAARQIIQHVRGQLRSCGSVSSDRAIIVETYQDDIGDTRVVVHSPFGGRINGPWSVAAIKELVDRGYIEPESQVNDDGFMLRLHDDGGRDDPAPIVDAVAKLTSDVAKRHLLDGIIDSPMFGATFRQNASRSMLMPNVGFGRRTPFWLQRLRARDLLTAARDIPDFPVLLETYRDVMEDVMDIPALTDVLDRIQRGDIAVHHAKTRAPSLLAQSLDFRFEDQFMYEWDTPNAERALQRLRADRNALAALFREPGAAGLLNPEAIDRLQDRSLGGELGSIRSVAEALQMLQDFGDFSNDEIAALECPELPDWLAELAEQGSATQFNFPTLSGDAETRWIAASDHESCHAATGIPPVTTTLADLIARHIQRRGVCTVSHLRLRYAVGDGHVDDAIRQLTDDDFAAQGYFTDSGELEVMSIADLEEVRARTMRILRAEVQPASPMRFQQLLLRHQHLGAEHRLHQPQSSATSNGAPHEPLQQSNPVASAIVQLQGLSMPPSAWSQHVLPARINNFSLAALDQLLRQGDAHWIFTTDEPPYQVALLMPNSGRSLLPDATLARITGFDPTDLAPELAAIYELIAGEGVIATADISRYLPSVDSTAIADRLATLARRSLITCDSWGTAHAIADWTQQRATLQATANPRSRPTAGRAHHRRRSALRRDFGRRYRARQRLAPPDARWSPSNRLALLGPEATADEVAAVRARQLLERHGVATRQAIRADRLDWSWRPIYDHLNLMELRGDIRRGYFVRGIGGIQFAASDFVDQLRADTDASPIDGATSVPPTVVRGSDPAWILRRDSQALGDESVKSSLIADLRGSDATIVMTDRPVLASTSSGAKLHVAQDADAEELTAAAAALVDDLMTRQGATSIRVAEWNGAPVLKSDGVELLEAAGLRRDYPYMIADSLSIRTAAASYN